MAIYALSSIKAGKQSVLGAAVAATVNMTGLQGFAHDTRKRTRTAEQLMTGSMVPANEGYIAYLRGEAEFDGDATFLNVLYPLTTGLASLAAPTTVSTTGKKWVSTFPTATNIYGIDLYTIEADGEDTSAQQMIDCYTEEITLSGKFDDNVKLKWKVGASQVIDMPGAAKTSLANTATIAYEAIKTNTGRVYIDDTTVGTTNADLNIVDFSLKISTGLMLQAGLDGSLAPKRLKRGRPKVELDITFDTDGASFLTERNNWRNEVYRRFRIEFKGSTIAGSSPTQANTLTLDIGGLYDSFDKMSTGVAGYGTTFVKAKLIGSYLPSDSTPLFFNPAVINKLSALI